MTDSDIGAIMVRLDAIDAAHVEIKAELVALQSWQTVRDKAAHDREVTVAAYTRPLRWTYRLWGNDFAKFILALIIASLGAEWLR